MDYNDNEYQSQNLQLAGEGSTKFPPVLRPYALPKFDFDDSLHGHLRFDSLVETEVFLGIESNEDNQWIEDFSRGSSGIEFRTSAAESCSISRHNNVWSEATSSESVEMLLKSVGLEDNITGKSIIRESDACDELGCLMKQMEQGSKHDDNSLSKVGDVTDVQPALSQNLDFSGLKDDVGGHPPVAVTLLKNECESSVDKGFTDAISDAVSGKDSSPLTKENNAVDKMKVDTLIESPNGRTEEDSSASGTQFDSAVTSAQNTNVSSGELNRQGASHEKTDVIENVDAQPTETGEHGEKSHFVQEAEMNDQNLDGNATDSGVPHSGNPPCLASGTKSTEEGNAFEDTIGILGEPSNRMPKGDSDLHIVEGYNEDVQAGKSEIQILLISNTSKVKFQETPSVAFEHDNSFEKPVIEDSNANNSKASMLSLDNDKGEGDGSSGSYAGISNLNVAGSAAELLSETEVTLTSKDINDDSGVCRGDSNAEVNVSSCILGDSSKGHEENVVPKQVDIQKSNEDLSVDVKESTEFPADSSNIDHKVGECIVQTAVASSSLGEVGTTDELIFSKSHADTTADNETDGALMAPTNVVAANAVLIHQEAQMVEACNEGIHNPQVVPNQVGQEGTEDMEVFPASDSTRREVDCAEAQVSGKSEEATIKENKEKKSSEVSDAELIPKNGEMLTQPLSLSSEEVLSDTVQNGQKENEVMLVSGDKNCEQIVVPCIDGEALRVHEGSNCSTPLSESDAKCHSLEGGTSSNDPDKPKCGSPTVIRAAKASQRESEKKGMKASTDQSIPVSDDIDGSANKFCSVTPDSKGIDASTDEKTFTFKVTSLADSSEREAGDNGQHVSTIQASTVSPIVEVSPTSGGSQLKPTPALDVSRGGLQVSDKETARSGSKVTSERKTRRASSKGTGRDNARKGNSVKDNTSVRQSEKRDKASNVALSPTGISQLVQPNEMQHYGHMEGSGIKPFNVLTTSVSGLPDLNTSSSTMFYQPFTDLQQVQLRAQIFVYGALIQGIAPDEAYMISAFGGSDGGRNIWETAWRACMDRIHGQKPLLPNSETPLQSRSGARAPDQAIKHAAIQGKVASSPIGRASSKGTPSPIINSMIPLSSPLWSIPTPSADALQSSGMPRSAVMDYPPALSPLHPQQTPPIRNFVGHNSSWMSQAPFRGTWVAPPQTSAFEAGGRFPVLPITETVHLTPAKELSVPHSSAVKHVSSGPMIHSMSAATVFPGTSSMLDPRKVTPSPGQQSTEPKSRKRKKTLVSEDSGQVMVHSHPQTEPVSAPVVTSHISTSVAITTPASFVSKASTEKVIMPVPPPTSTGHLKKGDLETLQRATLSEEALTKLKEARTQAEDAAAFAAAAVSQSQEIWNQLEKQKNSGLVLDVESKLASAAATIAAAAAVAKAAAAAANVASSAAVQAKLMADEALDPSGCGNSSQSNTTSLSDCAKDLGKATPVSILKGENAKSGPSSIIFAAREAARRMLEAASAASKRAENVDAIVKAAELAADAVSQAGKIVAMGDPLHLSELLEAGLEGGWKAPQLSTQLVANSNDVNREMNLDNAGEGPDTSAKHSKEVPLNNRETQSTNQRKSPTLREISGELFEDHARLIDGLPGPAVASAKNTKGHKSSKVSDLAKTIGVVPESEIGSGSSSISIQLEREKEAEPLKENSIKEGSRVEVFKEGMQLKAGWFTADVLGLNDGMAFVCYTELPSEEGSEKLKEWVALKGEGDKAPKIRIARPITAMPFEGTRKRRRAAMGEYTWSVGDRVDAWMGDSWQEGVVTEKNKKDETMYTVHFQGQGETATLRAWNLRPSLMWRDGEWVEWSSSTQQNHTSNEGGDTPQEKRLRLGNPAAESKGKDKMSKGIGTGESRKSDEPTLLDLSATEKVFNIGKNNSDENKSDALRMIRTGLQKEGSRVVFGVPKPGKKRKFMEVSKHYVVDQSSKINEPNDSVKFAKYLMPQAQGSGSRGWKNSSRNEPKEKRAAVSKPKVLKSGKPPPSVSGRSLPQKENFVGSSVSAPDDRDADHIAKIKDSTRHVDDSSGKHDVMQFQSLSTSEGVAEGPSLFSTMPLSSDAPSKKVSGPNTKTERVTKGKLAPAGGKLTKIEDDKVFIGGSAKWTSDAVEPRRSNRRIQPTSRLLEGLQSSLIISKIPSVSHDKNHKNQSRGVSRGNNNG